MRSFAPRGFPRAFIPRRAEASTQVAAVQQPSETVSKDISLVRNHLWIFTETREGSKVLGLKWVPGFWKNTGKESKESNQYLIQKIKTATITPGEIFYLSGLILQGAVAFKVGEMLGRWKIFGYHDLPPHHGHGFFTGEEQPKH